MTKAELLAQVEALPDDIIFLVSSDEEGNSFRTAHLGSVEKFAKYEQASGYVEWESVHPDDLHEYEGQELTDVAVFW